MVDDTQICHLSSNSTFETQAINFVSTAEGLHKPQNNATFSRGQYMAPYVWADEVRSLTDISIRPLCPDLTLGPPSVLRIYLQGPKWLQPAVHN